MQLTRFGVGNFTGLLEGGKVKALAVGLPKRAPLLPNVPTLDEAGLPGFPARAGGDLQRRQARRRPLLRGSTAEFVKLFSEPKFVAFLDKQSVVSAPTYAGGFSAFLKEDRKAAETLIRIANAKPEEYKPDK